jgi:cell division protein FtsQ
MRFFFHRKQKSSAAPDPKVPDVAAMPKLWPYRLSGNLLLIAMIASVTMIIITLRDNLINKKIDAVMEDFYAATAQYGWGIDDIIIQGRDKTTRSEILETLNLKRTDNILQLDLLEIKNKLEQLPWVQTAAVRRTFFPNVLNISLTEKNIIALWQSDNHFYPVDQNGKIIEAEFTPHQPILVIVGKKAPEKINGLLQVLSKSPEVLQRLKAARLFAGRRWDIILDDPEKGLTIKLPEKNMQKVWQKFMKTNHRHGLLKRKLTFIDLRYKNKLVVTVDSSAYADTKTVQSH